MKQEKYFEVGQTVYCALFGKGIVVETNHSKLYPIQVKFKKGDLLRRFSSDGRLSLTSNITLSQNYIPEIVNKPLCKFKKGDVVLVRDSDDMFWKITAFLEKTDEGWYRCSVNSLESDSMLYAQCIPYDNEIIEKQKDINKRCKLD